jgi:hypothetical protein
MSYSVHVAREHPDGMTTYTMLPAATEQEARLTAMGYSMTSPHTSVFGPDGRAIASYSQGRELRIGGSGLAGTGG